MESDFGRKLLEWHYAHNRREMPWKGETDPYKIWLSEVILQQTRVEQGWAYYEKFIAAFPTIGELASAPEQQVFKMWEGLGYYSRCKNLLNTARHICTHLGGKFPASYEELLQLTGIGPYTAAAIASFAYDEPRAVLDGNVLRVLARYFGLSTPIDTSAGRKMFGSLADSLLDIHPPAVYNQAIMDFGATICKPKNPLCSICIQADDCEAFRHGLVNALPVKEKSLKRRTRWLYYFIVEVDDRVYVRRRAQKDIWQNLYEFMLVERDQPEDAPATFLEEVLGEPFTIIETSPHYSQQLTHQRIHGQFFVVRLQRSGNIEAGYELVLKSKLSEYPFPKFINSYLESRAGV